MASNWKICYTKKAEKDFISLPKDLQKRIAEKMRFFSKSDDPLKFAERLKDISLGDFRFRVGNYRIIFDADSAKKEIYILKIRLRDKSYK